MESPQGWYIIKGPTQKCEIVSSELASGDDKEIIEKWGPFSLKEEAISRRIGLIRAGKCQPA
ncbi:MAG: DDE transposase family protein [Rivularia sp. (in: Bacteria)]|nr:DDE transposase family protein [Rivularia sp. MS3]